jgi:hypothetical protein
MLVGEYFAVPLVKDALLVELKTVETLDDPHRMQCTDDSKRPAEISACYLLGRR